MAGVRHEHDPGAAQFELSDEMVELASENPLAGAIRRRFESRQQEHVLHAVRFGALDRLRLLGAMAGDRQDDEIIGFGALDQAADALQDVRAIGLPVDQHGDVAGAHRAQRVVDIAGICNGSLELANVLIGIDADDQAANGAALGILQIQRGGRRGRHQTRVSSAAAETIESRTRTVEHLLHLLADKLDAAVQRVDVILAETCRVEKLDRLA